MRSTSLKLGSVVVTGVLAASAGAAGAAAPAVAQPRPGPSGQADALHAPEAKERGLFRPDAVERLLADPNGQLTRLRGNQLWQIGLLELWLQRHGITGAAA